MPLYYVRVQAMPTSVHYQKQIYISLFNRYFYSEWLTHFIYTSEQLRVKGFAQGPTVAILQCWELNSQPSDQ